MAPTPYLFHYKLGSLAHSIFYLALPDLVLEKEEIFMEAGGAGFLDSVHASVCSVNEQK